MKKLNGIKINILDFGYNWLWIIIPSTISFMILGPLSLISGSFKFSYELGIVISSLSLSISAAAIFYFALEFIPTQKRKSESKNLLNENIHFLDRIFLQHINNISQNRQFKTLEEIGKLESSELQVLFLGINLTRADFKIKIPGSKSIGEDSFVDLLISSTNRAVDLKDIILFAPDFYSIKSFEYINRVLWFQEMLKNNKERDSFTQQLAFELVLYYLKFKSEIKQ